MPESDTSRAFGFDLAGREGPERVEIRRSSLGVSLIPKPRAIRALHVGPPPAVGFCSLPLVSYPKQLLSPGETIVAEFRPHWTSILVPLVLTFTALIAVALLAAFTDGAVRQWG